MLGQLPKFGISQSYAEFTLKEQFDAYNDFRASLYSPCTQSPNTDQDAFGDGMSVILEAYINMYQTTKDKPYLYKFIAESLCMIENRHDYAIPLDEDIPRWSQHMYHNGNIIAGFARFVHFVKIEEPALYSEELYPFAQLTGANDFALTFTTFGEYADWLQDRCGETIWWFITNGYWDDDYGFASESSLGVTATDVNQQAGFARSLLFIGLTSGETSFLDKAMIIANLYKSNVVINDPCESIPYNEPMLLTTSENSYWWYQYMWGIISNYACDFDAEYGGGDCIANDLFYGGEYRRIWLQRWEYE